MPWEREKAKERGLDVGIVGICGIKHGTAQEEAVREQPKEDTKEITKEEVREHKKGQVKE